MAMSKKDYELIARHIARSDDRFKTNKDQVAFVKELAAAIAAENTKFRRAFFIRACIPPWVTGTRKQASWDQAIQMARWIDRTTEIKADVEVDTKGEAVKHV